MIQSKLPDCDDRLETVEARDGDGKPMGDVHGCTILDAALGWHALSKTKLCELCHVEGKPRAIRVGGGRPLDKMIKVHLVGAMASNLSDEDHKRFKGQTLAEIIARAKRCGMTSEEIALTLKHAVDNKRGDPQRHWEAAKEADRLLRESGDEPLIQGGGE